MAAAKPRLGSLRSCSLRADQAGSTAVHLSGPAVVTSVRSLIVQAGPLPSGRSNRDRRRTAAPVASAAARP